MGTSNWRCKEVAESMIFFVNQYLLTNNSSIEHAEMKRLKLFKQFDEPASLVLRDYLPLLDQNLKRFGVARDSVIDMFDFFAGATDYPVHKCHVEDLHFSNEYQVSSGNNFREVKNGDRLVAEVHFIGGEVALVDHVDYFDDAGNLTLRKVYDYRGFMSKMETFGLDGNKFYESYHRPDGSIYLESYYVKSVQNTPINSRWVLPNYRGHQWCFDSQDDLFTFFLDELNHAHGDNNVFIADRPAIAINPVLNMASKVQRYLWMAIPEVNGGNDLKKGPFNTMIQNALVNHAKDWAGIITMTAAQKENLEQRLGKKHAPITVINGSPVPTDRQHVAMDDRDRHHVIYVGRLGGDKQIDRLLRAFQQVHNRVQDATLTIYGYGDQQEVQSYQNLQQQLGLAGVINFAGYQPDVDLAYDQAGLLMDASASDVQPLAMAEALSHGVPVVSFDYQYGPAELVENDVNGYLVHVNDEDKLARQAVKILTDSDLQDRLSAGAYDHWADISDDQTMAEWRTILPATSQK